MKQMKKINRFSVLVFFVFIFVVIAAFLGGTSKAYAYITADLDSATVIDVYDESTKNFSAPGLKALAEAAGYTGDSSKSAIQKMIDSATEGGTSIAAKLAGKVIQLGKDNSEGGSELKWAPVYLSRSTDDLNGDSKGDAILTLWLATDIYSSSFSDGTHSQSATQNFNGTDIYSNTYDGSFIRHQLSGKTTGWTTNWGNGSNQGNANANIGTMVSDFNAGGALASYVTKPSKVGWQTGSGSNHMKNDPNWAGDSSNTAYPCDWINDNVWLPSVYEVVDKDVAINSKATSFSMDGGLWDVDKGNVGLLNVHSSWLRSSHSKDYCRIYTRVSTGSYGCYYAYDYHAVRPALHLNLTEALINAHTHDWQTGEGTDADGWKVVTPANCTTKGTKERVCTAPGCYLTGGKETKDIPIDEDAHTIEHREAKAATCTAAGNPEYWQCTACKKYYSDEAATNELTADKTTIVALGHDFATTWSKDENNHWHACSRCKEKDGLAAHTWNSGTETTAATCTEKGEKLLTCTACGQTKTEETPALGHDLASTYSKDGNNHWHACSRCEEKGGLTAHTWNDGTETTAATCTGTGEKLLTCTACAQTKNEEIAALGHNYVAVEGGVAPTCTTAGSGKVKCSRCNDEKSGDSIPALGHDLPADWEKDDINHWHTCSRCSQKQDEAPHDWNGGEVTTPPTATTKGVKTYTCNTCAQTKTEEVAENTNSVTLQPLSGWTYGDPANTPSATAIFGTIKYTYSDSENGTYSATVPTNAGTYWVKATVEADPNGLYPAAEAKASFTIEKRAITVEINGGSSEQGKELEALTATVTSGSIVGDDEVYTLSTNADKATYGTYTITGSCANENYNITFVEGVYIVSKRTEDPSGGGAIDLPTDANVEFKVTQSKTTGDYSALEGMKVGYWAQLWERKEDGTLGDEYTEELNCVLTLKIPTEIIEAIRNGEEINRDKIAAGLGVYYVTDGGMEQIKAFNIAQREDESWIVKFNYNSKFRAEVVFNAPAYEQPEPEPEKEGIPWWVWLIVGLGAATLITVIIVAVVLAKKKRAGDDDAPAPVIMQGTDYDDAELKAQLAAQNKRLEDLENRDDGGFNAPYDGEE